MKLKYILIVACSLFTLTGRADEGMWMLTDLQKQNEVAMTELGLLIPANQIYNPDGIALKDAVIHFGGGCTGEVISAEGLVLTNHHCGYGRRAGVYQSSLWFQQCAAAFISGARLPEKWLRSP